MTDVDAFAGYSPVSRKSTFDTTEITVRILGPGTPTPSPESYSEEQAAGRVAEPAGPPTFITYGSKKTSGLRQSRRIREGKERGKRCRVTITNDMLVKDLKVLVSLYASNRPALQVSDALISFTMSSGSRSSPNDCFTAAQSSSTVLQL